MSRRSQTKFIARKAAPIHGTALVLGICVFLAAITWVVFGQANLTWVLATWPEDRIRDGKKAGDLAERVDSLTQSQNVRINITLAAAYAEVGRFADAVKTAERAYSWLSPAAIRLSLVPFAVLRALSERFSFP